MKRFGYLAVEGQVDVEFVARLLRQHGLRRVRRIAELNDYWRRLVPTTFPHGGDLLRRAPMPLFVQSETHSVGIHSAEGDARLAATLGAALDQVEASVLAAVGLVLDADTSSPADRVAAVKRELHATDVSLPDEPGRVATGTPRTGVFVLPDNVNAGTVEDVLLECARHAYPDLLSGAESYVDAVDVGALTGKDRRELAKPAGRNKAAVSAVASVLKPGKSIQVSVQDNRWVGRATLGQPLVEGLHRFLAELLGFDDGP